MISTAKDRLIAKIRALQAKTEASGCTEQEAVAAAHKVDALVTQYGLSLTEVDLGETACEQSESWVGGRSKNRIYLRALAHYAGVKYWMIHGYRQGSFFKGSYDRVAFFGLPADIEVAKYLLRLCIQALDTELAAFKRTEGYRDADSQEKRDATSSFQVGFAVRMQERFRTMAKEQVFKSATGRDLVPVRNAVVEQAFRDSGIRLSSLSRRRTHVYNTNAYHSGRAAASRTSLNRGVRTGGGGRYLPKS